MGIIGFHARHYSALVAVCLFIAGCPSEPEPPPDPPADTNPQPQLIRDLGTVIFRGGKAPSGDYWVWDRKEKRWVDQELVVSPITVRNDGLGAGAQSAATSTSGAAPGGKEIVLPNAALFAGGLGKRPEFTFASPQAYFYDFAANEWTGLEMASPRYGHTMTTLLDGRVLIVGGWDGQFVPNSRGGQNSPSLSSTEIFDPATRTFRAGGSLLAARSGHAAARLADGRVLIVGGRSGNTELTEDVVAGGEIYDPATDSFTATGGLMNPFSVPVATALNDGRVLVFGDDSLSSAEVFNPATDTFSSVGATTALHGFGATATKLQDGRVLILGGRDKSSIRPTAVAEVFDPTSNTFTAVAPMQITRERHLAILQDDGTVLVVGGGTFELSNGGATISFTDSVLSESFDPTTNTWSPLPDAPDTSSEGAGVLLQRASS